VTVNEQAALCAPASDAVHDTVVEPTGNEAPEFCVQLVETGALPPLAIGAV